jgi:hypothetical protein
LKQALMTAYGPGDALWEKQIDDLAQLYWRHERLTRAQTGMLRRAPPGRRRVATPPPAGDGRGDFRRLPVPGHRHLHAQTQRSRRVPENAAFPPRGYPRAGQATHFQASADRRDGNPLRQQPGLAASAAAPTAEPLHWLIRAATGPARPGAGGNQ